MVINTVSGTRLLGVGKVCVVVDLQELNTDSHKSSVAGFKQADILVVINEQEQGCLGLEGSTWQYSFRNKTLLVINLKEQGLA